MMTIHKALLLFGAQGNLGRAIRQYFKEANWHIICCDREKQIPKFYQNDHFHTFISYNIKKYGLEETSRQISTQLEKSLHGKTLQAAVCCAGAFAASRITNPHFLSEAEMLIESNILTSLLCTNTAIKMIEHQQSKSKAIEISNIPSIVLYGAAAAMDYGSTPNCCAYGASKVYIHHMIQSLGVESTANEQAQSYPRFHICGIAPTLLDTPSNRDNMPDLKHEMIPLYDAAKYTFDIIDNATISDTGSIHHISYSKGSLIK